MVDLQIPRQRPVFSEAPQNNAGQIMQQGTNALSRGLKELGADLESIAVPLAKDAGERAGQNAISIGPDGKINIDTPATSFIMGKAGEAYAAAKEAEIKTAARTQVDQTLAELRVKHQGNPTAFQEAAASYLNSQDTEGEVGRIRREYGMRVANQHYVGEINARAARDVATSDATLVGRQGMLEEQIDGLVGQGGVGTPEYNRLVAERQAIVTARTANPLFKYTPEMSQIDEERFATRQQETAAVSIGRSIYQRSGNLVEAVKAMGEQIDKLPISQDRKIQLQGRVRQNIMAADGMRQQQLAGLRDEATALKTAWSGGAPVSDVQVEGLAGRLQAIKGGAAAAADLRASAAVTKASGVLLTGTAADRVTALQGIAKEATSPRGAVGEVTPGVVDRIIGVESGGNPNAKNPLSSATGAGQFIESTWLEMIGKNRPDLAAGKSRAEILALRTDPVVSREMTQRYAEGNAAYLRQQSVAVTSGSIYLAHFLGPDGAARVLRASPGASVETIVGADAVAANRSILAGKTAADVVAWADRKMEGAASGASPEARVAWGSAYKQAAEIYNRGVETLWDGISEAYDKGIQPTDGELRDLATLMPLVSDQELRGRIKKKLDEQAGRAATAGVPVAAQQAVADAARVAGEQGGLGVVQRRTAAAMTDQAQKNADLIKSDPVAYGRSAYGVPREVAGSMPEVAPLDFTSPDALRAGLAARQQWKDTVKGMDGSASDVVLTGSDRDQIIGTLTRGDGAVAGMVLSGLNGLRPGELSAIVGDETMRKALVGLTRSGDPSKMDAAFSFMDAQRQRNPVAFDATFGRDTELMLEKWQSALAYYGPQEASKRMLQSQDPAQAKAREFLREEANGHLSKTDGPAVLDKFGGAWRPAFLPLALGGTPDIAPQAGDTKATGQALSLLRAQYSDLYRSHYEMTGDKDAAEKWSVEKLRTRWAPSVGAGGRLMFMAPEAVIMGPAGPDGNPTTGQIGGSWSWVREQLDEHLAGKFGTKEALISKVRSQGRVTSADQVAAQKLENPSSAGAAIDTLFGGRDARPVLVADRDTMADVSAGRAPSYMVVIQTPEGRFQAVEGRFRADREKALEKARGGFDDQWSARQRAEESVRSNAEALRQSTGALRAGMAGNE
jgi:hypothetical protein